LCSALGTLPEVREGRERMTMTVVTNIKVEEECAKLYEESMQIWIDLVEYPKMKVVEAKLREAQEKAKQASEKITTFPLVERMTTILS
jgi:hypothetical protein